MDEHRFYKSKNPQVLEIEDAGIAVRTYGKGKPLVFIHGFFVHGYTWRKLLPELATHFTCYVVDLPGFGDSFYDNKTDFTFTAQAKRLNNLFQRLGINKGFSLIAHDTGASIARLVALEEQNNIEKMVLINTEMPGHRPPFIPMHQLIAKFPFANLAFRTLLKCGPIVRSPLLLHQFFFDKNKLRNKSITEHYVKPLQNHHGMYGMLEYLKGIEWGVVDEFAQNHQLITAEVLLIWGEEDKTFPVKRALEMCSQFNKTCQLVSIKEAALMPHEEQPEDVLKGILSFIRKKETH
ncbi:MAG: alpha/beta fold hydrolase [Aureispira sp.]